MRVLWAAILLLPALAAADDRLSCVSRTGTKYREPDTLAKLMKCQQEKFDAANAAYLDKKNQPPPASLVDNWQDLQRGEVNDYLRRHPERASMDSPADKTADEGSDEPKARKPTGKFDKNPTSPGLDELNRKLQAESNGGKDGVTPDMARQIGDYLKQNQGSISPDMQALLNGVGKDGAKLSADTVQKLQDAASQAKGQGLDLNTDQKTEQFLLGNDKPDPNQN